jgi:hypothetical protein
MGNRWHATTGARPPFQGGGGSSAGGRRWRNQSPEELETERKKKEEEEAAAKGCRREGGVRGGGLAAQGQKNAVECSTPSISEVTVTKETDALAVHHVVLRKPMRSAVIEVVQRSDKSTTRFMLGTVFLSGFSLSVGGRHRIYIPQLPEPGVWWW